MRCNLMKRTLWACPKNYCEIKWEARSNLQTTGWTQITPKPELRGVRSYISRWRELSQLTSCSMTRCERASLVLRKGHLLGWHKPTGCTTAGDANCAGQASL